MSVLSIDYLFMVPGVYTVDVEQFAGLKFRVFNPTEVFAEIPSCFLSQKYLLLKRIAYIYRKTFAVVLKTVAQRIFPRLR